MSPWADDEWDARHTLRELRLMYLLRGHPNVVSLHDAVLQPAGSDDLFIVMELMDSDLHRVILKYAQNPFPTLFKRGLCVALTTDDPLMFHTTPTPLLEEYATARHAFALSSVDMCEIARNSCVAAFSDEERMDLHNDENPDCTNVPACRLNFRQATLQGELDLLAARGGAL